MSALLAPWGREQVAYIPVQHIPVQPCVGSDSSSKHPSGGFCFHTAAPEVSCLLSGPRHLANPM